MVDVIEIDDADVPPPPVEGFDFAEVMRGARDSITHTLSSIEQGLRSFGQMLADNMERARHHLAAAHAVSATAFGLRIGTLTVAEVTAADLALAAENIDPAQVEDKEPEKQDNQDDNALLDAAPLEVVVSPWAVAFVYVGHGLTRFLVVDSVITFVNQVLNGVRFLFYPPNTATLYNPMDDHTDAWKKETSFLKVILGGIGYIASVPVYGIVGILALAGVTRSSYLSIGTAFTKAYSFLTDTQNAPTLLEVFSLRGALIGLTLPLIILTVGAAMVALGFSEHALKSITMGWRAGQNDLLDTDGFLKFFQGGLLGMGLGAAVFALSAVWTVAVSAFKLAYKAACTFFRSMGKGLLLAMHVSGGILMGDSNPLKDAPAFTGWDFLKGGVVASPFMALIVIGAGMMRVLGLSVPAIQQLGSAFEKSCVFLAVDYEFDHEPSLKEIFSFQGGILGIVGSAIWLVFSMTIAALGFSEHMGPSIVEAFDFGLQMGFGLSTNFNLGRFLRGGLFGMTIGLIVGLSTAGLVLGYRLGKALKNNTLETLSYSWFLAKDLVLKREERGAFNVRAFLLGGGLLSAPLSVPIMVIASSLMILGFSAYGYSSLEQGVLLGRNVVNGGVGDFSLTEFFQGGLSGIIGGAFLGIIVAGGIVGYRTVRNMLKSLGYAWDLTGSWLLNHAAPALDETAFKWGGFFALPFMGMIVSAGVVFMLLGISTYGFSQLRQSFWEAWSFITISSESTNIAYGDIFAYQGGLLGLVGSALVLLAGLVTAVLGFSDYAGRSWLMAWRLGQGDPNPGTLLAFIRGGLLGMGVGIAIFVLSAGLSLSIFVKNIVVAIAKNIGKSVALSAKIALAIFFGKSLTTKDMPSDAATHFLLGGFLGAPAMAGLILSAAILRLVGLSPVTWNQLGKAGYKMLSFLTPTEMKRVPSLKAALSFEGGILGVIGSAVILMAGAAMVVFGISIHAVQSVIQAVGFGAGLAWGFSMDAELGRFLHGGILGISVGLLFGLSAAGLVLGYRLASELKNNALETLSYSWSLAKDLVLNTERREPFNVRAFLLGGGLLSAPLSVPIMVIASGMWMLGFSAHGFGSLKQGILLGWNLVNGGVGDFSLTEFFKGGLLGIVGGALLGLIVAGTVVGLRTLNNMLMNMGYAGNIVASWMFNFPRTLLDKTSFKWGGFFALPFMVMILGTGAVLMLLGMSVYGFSQLAQSLRKAGSFIAPYTDNTSYWDIFAYQGGLLGTLGSGLVLLSGVALTVLGVSYMAWQSFKMMWRFGQGNFRALDANYFNGGLIGIVFGLFVLALSAAFSALRYAYRFSVWAKDAISERIRIARLSTRKALAIAGWWLFDKELPGPVDWRFIYKGGLIGPLVVLFTAGTLRILGISKTSFKQLGGALGAAKNILFADDPIGDLTQHVSLYGGVLPVLAGAFALGVALTIAALGLSYRAYKSAKFGFKFPGHFFLSIEMKEKDHRTLRQFLEGGFIGVLLGSIPMTILATAYLVIGVPLTAAFRLLRRAFQAISQVVQAMSYICQTVGLMSPPPELDNTLETLHVLKQYSLFNRKKWQEKPSKQELIEGVNRHRPGRTNTGGYMQSFWHGLQTDLMRSFMLNSSGLQERLIQTLIDYAKANPQFLVDIKKQDFNVSGGAIEPKLKTIFGEKSLRQFQKSYAKKMGADVFNKEILSTLRNVAIILNENKSNSSNAILEQHNGNAFDSGV